MKSDPRSLVLGQLAPFEPDPKKPSDHDDTLDDDPKWHHLSKFDESIRAKWQHLQYFEETNHHVTAAESSCSSLASSEGSSNKENSNESRFKKLKKLGWRKLKAQFGMKKLPGTVSYNDFSQCPGVPTRSNGVCTAPDGSDDASSSRTWPNPVAKIRSSKSMQNLEQITRDSYYNLRDVTSNLKEKYHSRLELRQAKPKTSYQVFWDEGSEDQIRMQNMAMVGLA